mgnify:CR=1 FL=1
MLIGRKRKKIPLEDVLRDDMPLHEQLVGIGRAIRISDMRGDLIPRLLCILDATAERLKALEEAQILLLQLREEARNSRINGS